MDPKNNPGILREIVRLLERKLGVLDDIESSCCGVTFTQCHAIVEIGRAQSISLNELADLLGLDKSTMSRTINNLVQDDLVSREIDAKDRRYITIQLTSKGMESFHEIEEKMRVYFEQIYQAIPEAKRAQVVESLQLLLQVIPETNCCK